jgi:hypothetical protein
VAKGDKGGFVTVVDGDKREISAVISDQIVDDITPDASSDNGSGDEATPDDGGSSSGSADLPDEVDLPDDFPSDVPLPDDTRVTNASSYSSNGAQSFVIELYTKGSVSDVADDFKGKFDAKGWTQSIQTESGDGTYAAYAQHADGTGLVVTAAISKSDVEGYSTVAMTVNSN